MPDSSTPRFLQGVFEFEGKGLDEPLLLDKTLSYVVPPGSTTQPVYFRGGNSTKEMISVILVRDGKPMRYFPIGSKGRPMSRCERVARGGSALDPKLVASLVSAGADGDPLRQLSEREREVLERMAEGLTNTGIAKRLQLRERTVEPHVRHLLMKLQIPETEDGHRRVLAVLAHLSAMQTS
jgi:hypothetical protein